MVACGFIFEGDAERSTGGHETFKKMLCHCTTMLIVSGPLRKLTKGCPMQWGSKLKPTLLLLPPSFCHIGRWWRDAERSTGGHETFKKMLCHCTTMLNLYIFISIYIYILFILCARCRFLAPHPSTPTTRQGGGKVQHHKATAPGGGGVSSFTLILML